MTTTRVLSGRSLAVLVGLVGGGVLLAGCPNDYTCSDYRTCTPPDGSTPLEGGGGDAADGGGPDVVSKMDGTVDGKSEGGEAGHGDAADAADAPGDGFTCDTTQGPAASPCVMT